MDERRARRLPDGVTDIPAEEWAAMPPTLPRLPALPLPDPATVRARRGWWQALTQHAPFALLLLLAVFLLTINVATPWHSSHEDNGLVFESAAINHIRFGLGFTKGQDYFDATVNPPVITPSSIHPQGVSDAQEFQYLLTGPAHPELYGDHPALLGLTIAGSLLLFGYHFWAVRLVPILFTLGALLLFYRLTLLLFNRRVATFGALLFATFPIAAFYGRDVAHEAPTLCCEMGMTLCYVLWRRGEREGRHDGWLAGLAACVALGGAYGWPMLFFAWILCALDTLVCRRVRWRLALTTAGVSTLVFALVITQIAWANNWSLTQLSALFFERSGGYGSGSGIVQGYFWLTSIMHHNFFDFGPWTWLALPAALVFLWRQFRREGLSPRIQVIALFGLGGLAHILIFRDGAYVHDYWQFYLIPFYGALLGWGGVALAQRLAAHPWVERIAARMRVLGGAPNGTQAALLVAFSALALVMAAPFIYQLYAGGHLFQFPGREPVTPLLDIAGRLRALVGALAA
ncbi:MAG TPA: glycosyltransferase family 39 protein [Ktedonobacterales bacterium]